MASMAFYGALAGAGEGLQSYLKQRNAADLEYQKEALLQQLRTQQTFGMKQLEVDPKLSQQDLKKDANGNVLSGTVQMYNVFNQPVGQPRPMTQSEVDDANDKLIKRASDIANIQSQIDTRQDSLDWKKTYQQGMLDLRRSIEARNRAESASSSGGSGGRSSGGSGGGVTSFNIPDNTPPSQVLSVAARQLVYNNKDAADQARKAGMSEAGIQKAAEDTLASYRARQKQGLDTTQVDKAFGLNLQTLARNPSFINYYSIPKAKPLDSTDYKSQ